VGLASPLLLEPAVGGSRQRGTRAVPPKGAGNPRPARQGELLACVMPSKRHGSSALLACLQELLLRSPWGY